MPNKELIQYIVDNAMSDRPAEVLRGVNTALRDMAEARMKEIYREVSSELFNAETVNGN